MTLSEILNEVLSQSGFLIKGTFTNSPDPDDRQMVSIANRVLYEIVNWYDWSVLRKTHTVNIVVDQDSNRFRLPNDFQSFVPDSAWEEDGSRKVEYPVPNGRWFMYKFTPFSDGGTIRVRQYGNELEIHDPVEGESFKLEYISNAPVVSSEQIPKVKFDDDNDEFLIDDQVLILGIQAHWMQTKMMPQFQQHFQNYMNKMAEAVGRDSGGSTIGGVGGGYEWSRRRYPYTPLYLP